MRPIFIGITRSFWLAIATLALMFGQGETVIAALAQLLWTLWTWADALVGLTGLRLPGGSAEALTGWLMRIGPLVTFLAALQQRSGAARPYTLDPRALQ